MPKQSKRKTPGPIAALQEVFGLSPRGKRSERDLSEAEKLRRGPIDLPFLLLTLMLLAVGLIMLLSASSYASLYDRSAGYKVVEGVVTYGDPMYYFKRQAAFAAAGLVAMFIISRMDYQYLRTVAIPLLVVSIFLLGLVLTPLGKTVNGARRWIYMLLVVRKGPTFEPSELVKLGVVLSFSTALARRKIDRPLGRYYSESFWDWLKRQPREYLSEFIYLLPYIGVMAVILLILAVQHHLSGAILIVVAAAAVLFVSGIKLGWFGAGLAAGAAAVYFVLVVVGYNGDRIKTWLDPWWDPVDKSYQVVQSLYAVASGGLSGLGFGQSRQKYLYLPEEQNDFIFAIICEELGMIGAILIMILFAMLIIRGYYLAIHAKDRFGSLVIVGIITLLGAQVFLNIAVVLNFIPATGISLPFFSYGGTALMLQLAEMGIILSVSRQISAPAQG